MVAPAIFFAITGYFGWNATQGDRGLVPMPNDRTCCIRSLLIRLPRGPNVTVGKHVLQA